MNGQHEIAAARSKILKIEGLLAEVKKSLSRVAKEEKLPSPKMDRVVPSPDELRKEFDSLYSLFLERKITEIKQQLLNCSKAYLHALCAANDLPLDAKRAPKNQVVEDIVQWLAQRKAISQKVR